MKVFEESWIKSLEKRYDLTSKYTTPFIVRLALDPIVSKERAKIEKWFQTLPEDVKPDILGRLRDKNSHQHFGAYYELVLYQFFKSIGYSVSIHPKLKEGEPDLLVTGKNLEKPTIIEIATVFDDPDWTKAEQKVDMILDRLNSIKHYFFVSIMVHSEHIPEKIDYKRLIQFVEKWLDSFDPNTTHTIQETEYEVDELKLTLSLIPKKPKQKDPIVGGHMLPARFVGTTQLRRMLEKKIKKYKSVKDLKLPFIIALTMIDMPAGETGLLNELFGKVVVIIKRTPNGDPVSTEDRRDFSGLFTPKPGLEGKPQNTRLSAVLITRSRWLERGRENEPAKRLHNFGVIYNPWACNPSDHKIFEGYPQFVTISEDKTGINLGWINKEAEKPFDC
ncbi:MAG: hypothetical protein A2Z76_00015 [Chloroflexi bacterium RBG_13_56_8b]|nr:MAG: hypothetical protein A2Z76_00015 [Chloroflexi bacterium RBG_13_56_8b]